MRETTITFPSGAVTIAGSLVIPDGVAPYPTALLIAGSGPLDRDANHNHILSVRPCVQSASKMPANGPT